jgi:hypothetical protein
MIISKKHMSRLFKGVIAAMPAIPYALKRQYVLKRQRGPIASYILGGIGLALVGGIAAVMLLSPRARDRALYAAKDTYGKMNRKVSHLRHRGYGYEDVPRSNFVEGGDYSSGL